MVLAGGCCGVRQRFSGLGQCFSGIIPSLLPMIIIIQNFHDCCRHRFSLRWGEAVFKQAGEPETDPCGGIGIPGRAALVSFHRQ